MKLIFWGFSISIFLSCQVQAGTVRNECRKIIPVSSPPMYAEDYPLPLSLRRNLVFRIGRKMVERGEYNGPIDGVYHLRLEAAVRQVQKKIGEKQSGCLTWTLIDYYLNIDTE